MSPSVLSSVLLSSWDGLVAAPHCWGPGDVYRPGLSRVEVLCSQGPSQVVVPGN